MNTTANSHQPAQVGGSSSSKRQTSQSTGKEAEFHPAGLISYYRMCRLLICGMVGRPLAGLGIDYQWRQCSADRETRRADLFAQVYIAKPTYTPVGSQPIAQQQVQPTVTFTQIPQQVVVIPPTDIPAAEVLV